MPIAARQIEAAFVQHTHNLGHGAELQERLEHKLEPLLYLDVRILDDHPARIADKTDRQSKSKLAALGFCQKACSQAAADRVQFKLGDGPLQTEEQATIGAAGVIDPVSIGDEAGAQPTNVQEWIPVGTIAREARHIDRQDEPDFAEPDPANELLEAAALCGGGTAQAEIGIDNIDISVMPSEFAGALPKRILQAQAFLIADRLMGCRLSDVDNRLARQMCRLDQFGFHEKSPPRPRRRPRRSGVAAAPAVSSTNLLDLPSSLSKHSITTTRSCNASILSLVRLFSESSHSVAAMEISRLDPLRNSTS